MHKFKRGDRITVQLHDQRGNLNKRVRKAIYIGRCNTGWSYIMLQADRHMAIHQVANVRMRPVVLGTFTLRKARGGWRYNVQGLNGEPITTSEVLSAKQSATEMHERHYRNYKLVDKTVTK